MDHLARMYQTMDTKTIFVKQARKKKKCWKANTKMASSSRDESEGTQQNANNGQKCASVIK